MDDTPAHDVPELPGAVAGAVAGELRSLWSAQVRPALLSKDALVFETAL